MIEKIISALQRKKLSGWQIRAGKRRSFQSFLAKEHRESRRTVDTQSFLISIYQLREASLLGMSNFKINPGNIESLDAKLDEAIFAASLVGNQPFELPENPKELPTVDIVDNSADEKSLEQCEQRLLEAVRREKGIRLSSAEFFINQTETRIVNHKGLDVSQKDTTLETEFILLAKSDSKENEFINRYTRRFLSDFDLEGEVRQSAQFASDATKAVLPKTGSFPVILAEEPLDHLFNPLVARASARLKYNKMMEKNIGDTLVEEGDVQGDAISLYSNGLLRGAMGSSRFDSYGTPMGRVCLIERNVLKTHLADKRYSDYLKIPVTGEMGNTEIEAGTTPFDKLNDIAFSENDTIYVLQAFSAFEPNPITGAYSAEIRAGYEITKKGTRPIKGGSVSGVLQRDLLRCHLSKERLQREQALVPKGILFKELTIAGS